MRSVDSLQARPLPVDDRDPTPQLLRIREVAQIFRISTRQVWKLMAAGRFPKPLKIGRSSRWLASDIEQFIQVTAPRSEHGGGMRSQPTTPERRTATTPPANSQRPPLGTGELRIKSATDYE